MAIYSLHVSNVSRAAGSSAVASCSYITSRRMRDERTGEAFNGFGRRERVEHVCTMLPEGAPGEYLDPERLFNAVEMAEKRSDARPAKKIMVALPREFDARERFRALEDFISWNITANGYACTYAIHTDKDGRNPHAHILVANRRIDPKTGRWAAKSRSEFALDANGRRIPVIDPDTGRQKIGARNRKVWKRVNVSNNPLDSKEFLERLRREWADSCNALLPGYAVIDHRSFKARGIERIPTIHEGYASREMEKRGQPSDRMAINREIGASNRDLAEGDAAVDALRAHQSELRRLLRDMADRAAQAFDRMLESIGHGVDPSDAVEAMRDRDGINLMIPRNAKDSDRPVWHAWLYDRHEWAAIPSHVLREGMRTVGRVRAAIGTALHRWRDAQAARRERIARSTPAQAPRLADVARQAREDAGQPAHQPRPVRKPEQQPEQQRERPVSLAAAAKEASKQLKREQQQEPEPEPALEWNPWDPADPMNLGMGGGQSQGYGFGL